MLSLYVWLATVGIAVTTVAPLARRRLVYERRRWLVLEALRKLNTEMERKLDAIAHAFQQLGMAATQAGEAMRPLIEQFGKLARSMPTRQDDD